MAQPSKGSGSGIPLQRLRLPKRYSRTTGGFSRDTVHIHAKIVSTRNREISILGDVQHDGLQPRPMLDV